MLFFSLSFYFCRVTRWYLTGTDYYSQRGWWSLTLLFKNHWLKSLILETYIQYVKIQNIEIRQNILSSKLGTYAKMLHFSVQGYQIQKGSWLNENKLFGCMVKCIFCMFCDRGVCTETYQVFWAGSWRRVFTDPRPAICCRVILWKIPWQHFSFMALSVVTEEVTVTMPCRKFLFYFFVEMYS